MAAQVCPMGALNGCFGLDKPAFSKYTDDDITIEQYVDIRTVLSRLYYVKAKPELYNFYFAIENLLFVIYNYRKLFARYS